MILVWSSPETLVRVRSVLPRSSLKCLSSPSLQRCMTTGSQRSANVCCSGKTWGSEERERGEKKKKKRSEEEERPTDTQRYWAKLSETENLSPGAPSEAGLVPAVAEEENWCADSQIELMVVWNCNDLLSAAVLAMLCHTWHSTHRPPTKDVINPGSLHKSFMFSFDQKGTKLHRKHERSVSPSQIQKQYIQQM